VSETNKSEAENHYKQGIRHQNRLEIELAIRSLRRAVKLSGFRSDYCHRLAYCYEIVSDFTNSQTFYTRAVSGEPEIPAWQVRLGTVCCRLGLTEVSNGHFRKAWLLGVSGADAIEMGLEGWLPTLDDLVAVGGKGLLLRSKEIRILLDALTEGNQSVVKDALLNIAGELLLPPIIWRLIGAACLVRGCANAAFLAKVACAKALVRSCDDPIVRKRWSMPDLIAAACIIGDFETADRLIGEMKPDDTAVDLVLVKIDRLLAEGKIQAARELAYAHAADKPDEYKQLKGKSIAVVGPAVNGLQNGKQIDAFDIVVRTNAQDADVILKHAEMAGNRTDIVYYNTMFFRSRREKIARFLEQTELKAVSIRHRSTNAAIGRLAPSVSRRIWRSYKKKNLVGIGFALRHIVFDLIAFTDSKIHLFGADFYLGETTHSSGYFDEGIDVWKEYTRHDVFDTFMFLAQMRKIGAISVDSVLDDILCLSPEKFCSRMEEQFSKRMNKPAKVVAVPKIGILRFDYHHFKRFDEELKLKGSYTVNLGDCAQTIAVKHALAALGVAKKDIVHVSRDGMRKYADVPAVTILNGVLYQHCFPPSANIQPLYFGLHAAEPVLRRNLEHFRSNGPIGCRDIATARFLRENGISAFVSGCLTLSLPQRKTVPENGKVLIVYGSKVGELPSAVLKHVPITLFDRLEFVHHRQPVWTWPLDVETMAGIEAVEAGLLKRYAEEASLVITPLHHVAAPCMAMGIPVVLVRNASDSRFSLLEKLIPIYLPDSFSKIDWDPAPFEGSPVRKRQLGVLARMVTSARSGNIGNFHAAEDAVFSFDLLNH
jgi:hypothetical protein